MTGSRGSTLLEAMVGLMLGALAIGVLAAGVLTGVRAFSLAGGVSAQVTAMHDGLERLRVSVPADPLDHVGGVPTVARRRTRASGRGRPDALRVESTWAGTHRFTIASEAAP